MDIDYNTTGEIIVMGALATVATIMWCRKKLEWARFYWILAFIAAANI